MEYNSETEHILLLPLMAHGHFRPSLQLALHLSTKTPFTITILTTPLNTHFFLKHLPCPTTIRVAELPFNSTDHGLPPLVENTSQVPLHLATSFLHATTSLEPHFRNFITNNFNPNHPPICIIFDFFFGWANRVANSIGSTGISFSAAGAYGTAAYLSVWNDLPHRNFSDDEEFSVPGFPENHRYNRSHIHRFMRFADGFDDGSRFVQPQIRLSLESSGWLCNSSEEIEHLGFDILRNYVKLPVWGIGPLIDSPLNNGDNECVIQWLSSQKPDSVLYISFGSQNTISPKQMMELAMGLEESSKPFLWVIRPPFGFDINGEFKPEWLPEKFEERMKEKKQGIVVHKWGPQLEILNHESTGGFLSHCGWNSVLESLRERVPILGWPLAAEQAYNMKMMEEEMGVGVELARGLEGEVSKEKVRKMVEMVLEREEGSRGWEMKKKAVEMGKKMKDSIRDETEYNGSSVLAMEDFVKAIVSAKTSKDK
uniref:Glycosyltransferase n=1 Tax=Bougainvillea spectabilis TaxID=146096 RepID=A0A096ZK20_9CARY|nr:cyclo-DOPA 5-O-glucosyltransferase [Bougainvillea spectabilis]